VGTEIFPLEIVELLREGFSSLSSASRRGQNWCVHVFCLQFVLIEEFYPLKRRSQAVHCSNLTTC
jgi:hypothetical protein